MKRIGMLLLFFAATLALQSQNRTILGSLYVGNQKEPVSFAIIQLLKNDSTYVSGTTSDAEGKFSIAAPSDGQYIVKASYVGFKTLYKKASITDGKDINIGQLIFYNDPHTLKEVTVTARAPKVVLKEDTFQYNASAYRVPEGSTIEALVKKLPGAELEDDGTIKINGKQVKKILVDGKEFMVGDTKTALKNIPTSIINNIKAYDKQSDEARVTGIDDGEEETVLDFGVKKGMNKGIFSNIDLGIGTKNRYSERGMVAFFNDKFKLMGFASANNTNDMGFGGGHRGGFGNTRQGLNATKMVGLNMVYDNNKTLQWDGSLRWNHADGDLNTKTNIERYVANNNSYSTSFGQQYTRSNAWNGNFRMEWKPDSLWNIMFRPNFSISKNDGRTVSSSASYNADPYKYTSDPLSAEGLTMLNQQGHLVNKQQNTTISYGDNKQVSGMLQVNRRLSKNGRNISLRTSADYSKSDSKTFSTQDLEYYQLMDALGNHKIFQAYRYNLMPTKSSNYGIRATYSEPIAKKTYLQFRYGFKCSTSTSDRSTYDLSSLGAGFFNGVTPEYRAWNNYLSLLPNALDTYYNTDLSRFSEYKTYTHEARLMLRMNKEKWQLNVGIQVEPQHTNYQQNYLGSSVNISKNFVNWSPRLDFRYRFNKQSNLRINYKGTTNQPSMSQLLSIVDNTDPQNISVGNSDLKPEFENNFRFFYNNFIQSHMQSIMTFIHFTTKRNAIGNSVTYNATTGARTIQPVNVDGNWGLNAAVMYNTSIDSAGVWNINTFTQGSYNRFASLLQQNVQSVLEKNITQNLTLGERLSASYRNSWLEIELDGTLDYTHTKNNLQAANNQNTWRFSYGTNVNVMLPWNMTIATDLHEQSRRGYNDASLNTNELIWNAQLSQSFLRGNALTMSVQFYDILRQQSNLSRVINATMRTDTEYNSINSYIMFKASYRLNLFGGKAAWSKGENHSRSRGGFNRDRQGGGGFVYH